METQILSSRNIVDLVFRERFGQDICGNKEEVAEPDQLQLEQDQTVMKMDKRQIDPVLENEGFVYGWDC